MQMQNQRSITSNRWVRLGISLCGVLAFFFLWEGASRTGWLRPDVAPSFMDTAAELGSLLPQSDFQTAVGDTLSAWLFGFAVTAALAIPIGLLFGANPWAWKWFHSTFEAVRPIPPIVLLPLAILVMGSGRSFTTVMIGQGVFWIILLQVTYGSTVIAPVALDTATVFKVGPWRRYLIFRLPSAAPIIATGLRIAAGISLAVEIMSELIGGVPGVGQLLISAQAGNDLPLIYALTGFTGLLGLIVAVLFRGLERFALKNHGPKGGAE